MALNYSPKTITDGLVYFLDAGSDKSRYGAELIGDKSDSQYIANQSVTITRTGSFIKAVSNQNTSTPGVWPIGNGGSPITVAANTSYTFRVRGYRPSSSSPAYLYVSGNVDGNLVWLGNALPVTNGWTENTFNTGSNTQIRVGILWSGPTLNSEIYIEEVGLHRNRLHNLINDTVGLEYTNGPTFSFSGYRNILFDGVNDRLETPSTTFNFSAGGTIELWLKLNAINRDQGFFGFNSSSYVNFWMPGSINQMRWEVIGTTASSYNVIYSTTVFTTGVWYHVVGTFDGTNITIYVNGTQETTTVMTNQATTTYTTTVYVGDYNAGGYPSSSNISIVRVYNRPLSLREIKLNYQTQRGRHGI